MTRILIVLAILAATITPSFALSQQELNQLNDLLQKRSLEVLGGLPQDAPYDRHYDTGRAPTPPPNCLNPKQVRSVPDPVTKRVFIRWHCDGPLPNPYKMRTGGHF
jgi:hypothetical protein